MLNWFDEPITNYRRFAPMRSGVFDYMSRWMDSVDREMEREFGDFFDPFFSRPRARVSEEVEEEHEKPKKQKKQPIVEEEEENEEEGEPQYYTCSSSMYTTSDGVQHIYREEQDSKSGKKKIIETRRIGNKSITHHKVTEKDGSVTEHESRHNIKPDEVDEFNKQWSSRNSKRQSSLPAPESK